MSSAIDRSARLNLLYRAADRNVDRDLTLLCRLIEAKRSMPRKVHGWKISACPLTTSALVTADEGVLATWETEQQIYFATLIRGSTWPSTPGRARGRRGPQAFRDRSQQPG
jgi:hypothetical protein